MLGLVLASIVMSKGLSQGSRNNLDIRYKPEKSLRNVKFLNLSETFFSSLQNYQVNADPVDEAAYPWIARVVHSTSQSRPHVCTAACIDPAIFVTAARCISSLKVNFTTVIYKTKSLRALAFVLPSEMSKQQFDDIGFIVVRKRNVKGTWPVIELFTKVNRTDAAFNWFSNLDYSYGNVNVKVVGYAMKKEHVRITEFQQFNLSELNVVIGLEICPNILTRSPHSIKGFVVPCYHSCSFAQMLRNHYECSSYHGVEGGALIDTLSNKLIGVATWGTYYPKHELPVGFAFANSETFYKDYLCARRIRDDNGMLITKGYYQSLCDS